jgi:hypothetical protein
VCLSSPRPGRHPDHRAEVALRQSQAARQGGSVVGDNVWLPTDRLTTLGLQWLRDVDFGHGLWTPIAALAAGERRLLQNVRMCNCRLTKLGAASFPHQASAAGAAASWLGRVLQLEISYRCR